MPRFEHCRLDHGLTLIAEVNPDAHTAAVGFFVKAGARDESPALMGASHFLEHMLFKGTERRSADDVNREFDELGANYNAFTSHEMTVYFAQVLPEFLPRGVDLLCDMLRPALRGADLDMERNVILEEIGMYEDRPQWRLHDHLLELFYADHPLAHRVLGTATTVESLSREQMSRYHAQRYGADNITVAAAGRIDFDQLAADLSRLTSHWQPTGVRRDYGSPTWSPREIALTDARLTRQYLSAACPAPAAQDPRRYAARIAADVVGDAEGSRLYWALVDAGLADEASLSFEPQDRTGLFVVFASCDPARRGQVEDLLFETLRSYAGHVRDDEIQRAKNKIATQATLQGERPLGRMSSLGGTWTYLQEYLPLEEELARIEAVTADDVRQVLASWPLDRWTIARLGPREGGRV